LPIWLRVTVAAHHHRPAVGSILRADGPRAGCLTSAGTSLTSTPHERSATVFSPRSTPSGDLWSAATGSALMPASPRPARLAKYSSRARTHLQPRSRPCRWAPPAHVVTVALITRQRVTFDRARKHLGSQFTDALDDSNRRYTQLRCSGHASCTCRRPLRPSQQMQRPNLNSRLKVGPRMIIAEQVLGHAFSQLEQDPALRRLGTRSRIKQAMEGIIPARTDRGFPCSPANAHISSQLCHEVSRNG
jgi:hypothetical protein